jgi:uncharacterized membrane protein
MKAISKLFIQGLMAILPIALTLYLIYWLATSAESVLGRVIRYVVGDAYVPGLGVLFGFLITLGVGVLLQLWLFRKVFSLGETLLQRIPGIKSLYGSIRDLVGFFDSSKQKDFDKTVMVAVGDENTRLMGLVTRESFDDLPEGIGDDRTVDQAMQFVLTAGVSAEDKGKNKPAR